MTKVKQLIPELMIDGMNASDIADLVKNLEEEGFSEEGIIEILGSLTVRFLIKPLNSL